MDSHIFISTAFDPYGAQDLQVRNCIMTVTARRTADCESRQACLAKVPQLAKDEGDQCGVIFSPETFLASPSRHAYAKRQTPQAPCSCS